MGLPCRSIPLGFLLKIDWFAKKGQQYWSFFLTFSLLSILENFEAHAVVDMEVLNEKGLIKVMKDSIGLKVLGNGTLTKAITVKASAFSASAKEAIEKAGGKVEQI